LVSVVMGFSPSSLGWAMGSPRPRWPGARLIWHG